jgi:hypothetical protein
MVYLERAFIAALTRALTIQDSEGYVGGQGTGRKLTMRSGADGGGRRRGPLCAPKQ